MGHTRLQPCCCDRSMTGTWVVNTATVAPWLTAAPPTGRTFP